MDSRAEDGSEAALAPPNPPGPFRPYALPLLIAAAHFAVFTLARAVLLASYGEDFSDLSAGDVAWAFARGLRFDASVIFAFIGAPLFLLLNRLSRPPMRGPPHKGIAV